MLIVISAQAGSNVDQGGRGGRGVTAVRSRDGGGGGGGGSGGGRGGGHGHGQSRPFMGVVRVVGCILIRTPVLYCRPTLAFYRYRY